MAGRGKSGTAGAVQQVNPEIEAAIRREALGLLARQSYKDYLRYVNFESWRVTRMNEYLSEQVQAFVEEKTGNAYDILVIETPPQHGKSMTVTQSFPSWYLGRYPKNRVIEISYNINFAEFFGRANRLKIEEFGTPLFGIALGSKKTNTEFELSNGWGRMISLGVSAGITGNAANLIVIDDPIKNREEADSETQREKLWAEWQNSMKSRLAAGGKVIVIMTPWHEDDFAARLLERERTARLIRLPVEAEPGDPLGRNPGDALCPELGKDNKWLEQFKASYMADPLNGGTRAWSALYQCSPRVEGGNIIQRKWWKYYTPEDVRDGFGTTVISVDAAFKGKENNDFVSIQVWSKRGNEFYLRMCLNQHMTFTKTVNAIRVAKGLYPETGAVLIEDKANGSAVIDVLQTEMFCIAVNPKGGKESRVYAVQPAIESGHVYLPDNGGVGAFVDQFSAFPAGQHDDMVDACTQALMYLLRMSGNYQPLPDNERREIEAADEERELLCGPEIYNVYGDSPYDGWFYNV